MQALFILLAIVLGILISGGHQFTFLIRYNLMILLFLAFLNVDFRWKVLRREHFILLVLNVLLPLLIFFLIRPVDATVALAVFVIGIAPTAAVAPVIADLFRSRVEFVTTSVLLSSPVIALVLPFLLSGLIDVETRIPVGAIMFPICTVIFLPFFASLLLKNLWRKGASFVLRFRKVSFFLFLANVYIASAKATDFISHDKQTAWYTIASIALMVCIMGTLLFMTGEWVGKKHTAMESSLTLGRKNTMFALWIALTFLNPVVALGPMFYIVFQNAFNSYQLFQLNRAAIASERAHKRLPASGS